MADYYWPRVKMVALDLETTGINRMRDRIIQYGMYGIDGMGRKIACTAVVDAEVTTGREPKNLPGVALIDVMKAKPLRHGHLAILYETLHGAVVIMHNASHDWTFVQQEFKRHRAAPPVPRATCCTLLWSRRCMRPPHKLHVLCQRLFINVPHAHNAFDDARATFYLMVILVNGAKVVSQETKEWFAVRSKYFLPWTFATTHLFDHMPYCIAYSNYMDIHCI